MVGLPGIDGIYAHTYSWVWRYFELIFSGIYGISSARGIEVLSYQAVTCAGTRSSCNPDMYTPYRHTRNKLSLHINMIGSNIALMPAASRYGIFIQQAPHYREFRSIAVRYSPSFWFADGSTTVTNVSTKASSCISKSYVRMDASVCQYTVDEIKSRQSSGKSECKF